ncbi:MAG: VCBS repeat-containing protein [Candidatus Hydrogenedentes bacterium]|nr:VCBS repeat-containing protein [Candidatus Hydrogenedentota bacterium]
MPNGYLHKSVFILVIVTCLFHNTYPQTFTTHPKFFQVGPNPSRIALGDLNGDNIPDIVTADRGIMRNPREERPANDELSILLSQGPINYVKLHPTLKTDFAPYDIAIANMDAQKWLDIVVVNFLAKKSQDIQIFNNLKDENIFTVNSIKIPDENLKYTQVLDGDELPIFTTPGLTSLVVKDINRDGLNDVISTGWSCDTIFIHLGDLKETLKLHSSILMKGGPRALAVSDFNNDSIFDLAILLFNQDEVVLMKGNQDLTFERISSIKTKGRYPNKIITSDINRDKNEDLIVAFRKADSPIEIIYNTGEPFSYQTSKTLEVSKEIGSINFEITDFTVADFNSDGFPDIALAEKLSRTLVVYINNGIDTKKTSELNKFKSETYQLKSGTPRAIDSSDLNGDLLPEIVLTTTDPDQVIIFVNSYKKRT